MMPLCQFNLKHVPFVPPTLADIALITLFVRCGALPPDGSPNGEGWLLRSYSTLDGLVSLDGQEVSGTIKPFPIRWEMIEEDYPTWDDTSHMDLPTDVYESYYNRFQNADGTKIGGWPATIQSEIFWAPYNRHAANPEYVLQVASEAKAHWSWGDAGIGYVGRGTGIARDQWTLSWQCF